MAADDRQFVLLDMNGTASPNSIGANGDRVLLYVADNSCRIRTAYQACRSELADKQGTTSTADDLPCNQQAAYVQSFYDVYKCTEETNQGVDSSHCATGAGNYDPAK